MATLIRAGYDRSYVTAQLVEPWKLTPTEGNKVQAGILETTKSLVAGFFFGFMPHLYSALANRLPANITDKMITFFSKPWKLINDRSETATMDKVYITFLSWGPAAFGVAFVASKFLPRSLLGALMNGISSHVNMLAWLQENLFFLRDHSRTLMWLSIPAIGFFIKDQGVYIRLSREVGPIEDYYKANISTTLYVNIHREFLQKHPLKALELYVGSLRDYIAAGHHKNDTENTRVNFKDENSGYHQGPTREFFFILFSSLIKKDDGTYREILGFTDEMLRERGSCFDNQEFYEALGLVFGAMARSTLPCGLGSVVRDFLTDAILVPDSVELQEDLTDAVLKKIAGVVYKDNKMCLDALTEDHEDLEALLVKPRNVFDMAQGMRKFFPNGYFSWRKLRKNPAALKEKVIGIIDRQMIADRISLEENIVIGSDARVVVSTRIIWLKNWLINEDTTDKEVKLFLISASGAPVIVFENYYVKPRIMDCGIIGFSSCFGYIHLSISPIVEGESVDGEEVFDEEEAFIIGVKDMISDPKQVFTML